MKPVRTTALLGFGGAMSCVFAAEAAYTGLYAEHYSNANYDPPPYTMTFRIYAMFDNSDDQLLQMSSPCAESFSWELTSETGFYQDDDFGGYWPHNANFDPVIPFLHYDSYWTIGTDDAGAGADLDLFYYARSWEMWWEEEQWYANGCGVRRQPGDPLTYPKDGMVLIGQFTIDQATSWQIYGSVQLTTISDGEPLTFYDDILIPIGAVVPAPGGLALLGLAGLTNRCRRR